MLTSNDNEADVDEQFTFPRARANTNRFDLQSKALSALHKVLTESFLVAFGLPVGGPGWATH
jgi:hypothetical protein